MTQKLIDSSELTEISRKLRQFFFEKNYLEVHTQSRLSILAACEDPKTVSTYNYLGQIWPLPQTGQMWLEYELLKQPQYEGFFCVSTSYRQEPNPIPGRHDHIFPMFEFESKGNMDDLMNMLEELAEYLGFGDRSTFLRKDYSDVASDFNVKEIETEHENLMNEKYDSPVILLKNFPEFTSPFFNMKRYEHDTNLAKKVDVIIGGMETIGSAERETDIDLMRERFYTISDGEYANLLYEKFGKERVERELEEFLALHMIERFGGGIGMTRLIKNHRELVSSVTA